MFSNLAADLALNAPCRAVDTIRADKVDARFVVASCRVLTSSSSHTLTSYGYPKDSGIGANETREGGAINYLSVLTFQSEVNELTLDAKIPIPNAMAAAALFTGNDYGDDDNNNAVNAMDGGVPSLRCSPTDPSLVLTASHVQQSNFGSSNALHGTSSPAAFLWKMRGTGSSSTRLLPDYQEDYNDDVDNEYYELRGDSDRNKIKITESLYADQESVTTDPTLEHMATFSCNNSSYVVDIAWRDTAASDDTFLASSSAPGDVLLLNRKGVLTQWDLSHGGVPECIRSVETRISRSRDASSLPRVAWDPHSNGDTAAVTSGRCVSILDWRVDTSIHTGMADTIPNCHRYGVSDIDYNPNKPYVLATAGQDGLLHFWDLRSSQRPLLSARGGHSHWIWNVQYNPFHDQLILSSGSDSAVNLWRFSTISSAPILTMDDDDDDDNIMLEQGIGDGSSYHGNGDGTTGASTVGRGGASRSGGASETAAPNVRVGRHEHGEAVYGSAWGSAANAWVYLTVSYDGKCILSHVPSKEKYKILL